MEKNNDLKMVKEQPKDASDSIQEKKTNITKAHGVATKYFNIYERPAVTSRVLVCVPIGGHFTASHVTDNIQKFVKVDYIEYSGFSGFEILDMC